MRTGFKKLGGVLSIVALLVAFAWTPGEAGLGGISGGAPIAVADSIDASLPWYFSLLQPVLTLSLLW